MRFPDSNRGFTLVELMVSMGLALIIMSAVFSTYLYLGRNLTRLSYRSTMENQSRKILNLLVTDVRNTTSIATASATQLTLKTVYVDPVTKAETKPTITYDFSAGKLTRDPDDTGAAPPAVLNYDIGDSNVQVPVTMSSFTFLYTTTSGNTYATAGTGPTYQNSTTLVPMSIKQVAISFTLQAGTAAIQGQQGSLSTYTFASGRLPFVNHQIPDGS